MPIKNSRFFAILGAIIAAVFILIIRSPGLMLQPQFYAEDASIFWMQEYKGSFLLTLTTAYAGYLHTIPRLAALLSSYAPVALQPRAYWLAAIIISAWTAGTIASLRIPALAAFGLALVPFLVAQPSGEIWSVVVNLQWITAIILPLAAMSDPPLGRVPRGNLLVLTAVASVTGPFSIAMAPLWIYRATKRDRDPFGIALAGLGLAGGAVQMGEVALTASPFEGFAHAGEAVSIAARRLLGEMVWGASTWTATMATVALLIATFLMLRREWQIFAFGLLVFGGAELGFAVFRFSARPGVLLGADRYFYPATAMLGCVMVLGLFSSRLFGRAVSGFLLIAMVVTSSREGFVRETPAELSAAWQSAAPKIGVADVEVPILPGGPDWILRIPARP